MCLENITNRPLLEFRTGTDSLTDRFATTPFQFDARQPPVQFTIAGKGSVSLAMSRVDTSVLLSPPADPKKEYQNNHSRVPVPPTSTASPPLLRESVGNRVRPEVSRRSSSENSTVISITYIVVCCFSFCFRVLSVGLGTDGGRSAAAGGGGACSFLPCSGYSSSALLSAAPTEAGGTAWNQRPGQPSGYRTFFSTRKVRFFQRYSVSSKHTGRRVFF